MANAQVQLVCLAPSLVITSVEKTNNEHPFHPFLTTTSQANDTRDGNDTPPPAVQHQQRHARLIPTLLELLFYSSERQGMDASAPRFLSYVETQHEISIVFEEQLLSMFPDDALEYEPIRWKALQVASAGTGAFLNQLAVLTELTTQLAKHNVSVFQISTYQTDYVLVKIEDLKVAITCLESFCYIEMENGDEVHISSSSLDDATDNANPVDMSPEGAQRDDLAVHHHVLSVPDIDLYLVQIDKSCVRRHMYNLIRLLFGHNVNVEGNPSSKGKLFLSYSETGDDISVVTYDKVFVEEMQSLASSGDQGVMVSPDSWKVVQVGDTNLGFAETGIVAGQTRVLLSSGTMVFYLSTFATDFMMIKEDEWDDALPILRSHFHVLEGRFAPLMTTVSSSR
uniref:CASTOR ACT domain-containing protein n=1 Tax=Globisporangium ultimum (strain ATCC 200006 / CBS 805.95 / DAOM BR144) TaxID=431595 RepID=K3X9C5_GLOUD